MTTKHRTYNVLFILILSFLIMNCNFGQVINVIIPSTPTPSQTQTVAPTSTATFALAPTKTEAVTLITLTSPTFETASIVGMWERHGKMGNRAYTEHLNFMTDATYHVEADFDDNGEVIATMDGTYTFDKVNIYYLDKNHKKTTESYKLNSTSDILIINNDASHPWKRVK
jgi:hypothetical protein